MRAVEGEADDTLFRWDDHPDLQLETSGKGGVYRPHMRSSHNYDYGQFAWKAPKSQDAASTIAPTQLRLRERWQAEFPSSVRSPLLP